MEITLGTGNEHKVFEINEIVKSYGINNIKFSLPDGKFNPLENGSTFEENSLIKAKEAAKISGNISLADDSGLCVEALNGAPGLYSARYADSQDKKIIRILNELKNKENRAAKFVCCMSLVDKNGDFIYSTRGECHGHIIEQRRGINGFGYDPIFVPNGYDITLAEMSESQKNSVSHRGNALKKMLDYIKENKYLS